MLSHLKRKPVRRLSWRSPLSIRRGFTLFEVLLALSLSVVLMVAVYGSLNLYLQLTSAGTEDMEQAQVARALLQKMAIDIRSTLYVKSNRVLDFSGESNNNDATTGTDGESDQNEDDMTGETDDFDTYEPLPVDPTNGFIVGMSGLVGDSEILVLHVSHRSRPVLNEMDSDSESELIPTLTGDHQSVSYFLAISGSGGLSGIIADEYEDLNIDGDDVQGLARLEGDRLAITINNEEPDPELLAEKTKLLAPEVKGMEFRYFDGLEWLESWDSGLGGSLPQAVEITLYLRAAARSQEEDKPLSDTEVVTNSYRYTVALPPVEPYIPLAE